MARNRKKRHLDQEEDESHYNTTPDGFPSKKDSNGKNDNNSTSGKNNNNNPTDSKNKSKASSSNATNNKSKVAKSAETTATVLSLPLPIWLIILKHLPLRHVTKLACVSREFFALIFGMPEFWIHVQAMAKCNKYVPASSDSPATRGIKCRQLVMNYMSTLCDYCYTGAVYSVESDGYKAVLPVRISQKDAQSIRRRRYSVYLCGNCRIMHFQRHPEPIYEDTRAVNLSREEATAKYCIVRKDITFLWSKEGDINRQSDAYMRLFARCIYGGDVGIDAEVQRMKYMEVDL